MIAWQIAATAAIVWIISGTIAGAFPDAKNVYFHGVVVAGWIFGAITFLASAFYIIWA